MIENCVIWIDQRQKKTANDDADSQAQSFATIFFLFK